MRGGFLGARLAGVAGLPAGEVRERFGRGARAWACWHRPAAELAAWLWVSADREWAGPLDLWLRFAGDECYGWDAGTLPAHRGRGLFAALLLHAGWRMAREGYRVIWGGIEDQNLASQRANAAAGYRPVLRVTAVHEPPPTSLHMRPADYADERLVERARRMLAGAQSMPGLAHLAARPR